MGQIPQSFASPVPHRQKSRQGWVCPSTPTTLQKTVSSGSWGLWEGSSKPQAALASPSRTSRHAFLSSTGSSDEEGRPWGGRREVGPPQCSHWQNPPGSSSWFGVAGRGTGTAAPAGNQFPSEPPPNDTIMLTPLSQLQRRRWSPRTSAHHLLPLLTASHPRHPSQAGGSKLQTGCHDLLGLFLPPGSCGHGATGHARYQEDDFCPPPHPFSHLSSPVQRGHGHVVALHTLSSLLRSLQGMGHAGGLRG